MQTDILNGFERTILVYCWVFLFLFALLQVIAFLFLSADNFQRLGSAWVAILVFVFGLMRFSFGEIHRASKGQGPFAKQVKAKIEPHLFSDEKGWLNYMSEDGQEFERPRYNWDEARSIIDDADKIATSVILPRELFLIVLATLQWGYGDLFHCWMNGKGWQSC